MGKNKKSKPIKDKEETEALKKAPHSFVFHRGKVGLYVRKLIHDIRCVMEPYTASKLKVLRKNVLKDFTSVAGPLGVTHMLVFSRTETALNMRLTCLPRGPTLTFRVHEYSLNRDVVSSLKKQQTSNQQYFHHPLLIMNNFQSDQKHLKLIETTFQNLFPSINVSTIKLNDVKRCLLLNYDSNEDKIYLRHYIIKLAPAGVSSSTRKLIKKKLPDLGKYADIAEYFLRPAQSSDSEYEIGDGENEVDLPGTSDEKLPNRVGIRLLETGPRMTLQLIKIQEGFCDGEVLYHKFVTKTAVEKEATRKAIVDKERLKVKRRKEQEENVARKKQSIADKKVRFKVEIKPKFNEKNDEELLCNNDDD